MIKTGLIFVLISITTELFGQVIKKIDFKDSFSESYFVVEPKDSIQGVLIL